ncbi:hypothetical protein XENTR_v10007265 [Xenopus tropicalis]|uniref:G-protein coupled receptors family 1 profile domain-containing protein n=1 Tax=Xenopus tropicalis TaxID=8364 RepID=A0A803J5A4_XENTR|nr:hypothetical protein XENTR_v10007265 [Xenopus tropicalis]|eukprot:XP_004912295.1 PREDICTED: olfactory receptor 6Y1-like [Xenopus tropicalis]
MERSASLNVTTSLLPFVSTPTTVIVLLLLIIFILLCFCIFLYIMAAILKVFFTTPHVRENVRYVLFIHMLITDSLYLFLSIFVFISAVYMVAMPLPICFAIVILVTTAFVVTPYNLAVLSLERYIAICHPLRHKELCTERRCNAAMVGMWVVGLIPVIADFITMSYTAGKNSVFSNIMCIPTQMFRVSSTMQDTMKTIQFLLSLGTVGLVILFTYIKVMLVAFKLGSRSSSAFSAGKTVLLHAFQLLLCMFSFTYTVTETYLSHYFVFLPVINFFFFMCLPRFISPMIYGMRDEVFRKGIRKCC